MINENELDADAMIDLIQDHELHISHKDDGDVEVMNYLEGTIIAARSSHGISDAIKKWVINYNVVIENAK